MKKRPRAERRLAERGAAKLVRDREKLALLEVGGAPDRPIEVTSAAVIDVRARAHPCPQCAGTLRLDEETAEPGGVRIAHVTCLQCGIPRKLWFRLVAPIVN